MRGVVRLWAQTRSAPYTVVSHLEQHGSWRSEIFLGSMRLRRRSTGCPEHLGRPGLAPSLARMLRMARSKPRESISFGAVDAGHSVIRNRRTPRAMDLSKSRRSVAMLESSFL
jgi:hypothetical protein